jgi:hypothetical protein
MKKRHFQQGGHGSLGVQLVAVCRRIIGQMSLAQKVIFESGFESPTLRTFSFKDYSQIHVLVHQD